MAFPYFYMERIKGSASGITLEEDTSKHVAQVLRMEVGEKLQLTDGTGNLHTAAIRAVHKKSTVVQLLSSTYQPASEQQIIIAISLVKNAARFEWFLEKATEIGVNEIIPLICERTEKHHFRLDRMKNILISAMLQSQQSWLPKLKEPINLSDNINQFDFSQKFIAHCIDSDRNSIKGVFNNRENTIILIGPEGDFTPKEIDQAIQNNFKPVTLGDTRLRTETAGIVAATLLKNYLS